MATDTLGVVSPSGGPVVARERLAERFIDRLSVNDQLSRRVVSYQGNRAAPGLRWMKYKEGFSRQLVADLIGDLKPRAVLDPFAGICTTPLVASSHGSKAAGIEIMPIGVLVGKGIATVANGFSADSFGRAGTELLRHVRQKRRVADKYAFPHVRITQGAFPGETEVAIAKARRFIASCGSEHQLLLNLACMSVLEETSYTRKDGQYLRWDHRADRRLRSSVDKGHIPCFSEALEKRLAEIAEDTSVLKEEYGGASPELATGSCLELLKRIPTGEFDAVITSPPYVNRYDYTRTYALELAWMGFSRDAFSALRQHMLSATVENKSKAQWLAGVYADDSKTLDRAIRMYERQDSIHEVLDILRAHSRELSNRNVLNLIMYYFYEMAVVIAELGRIVSPGGTVIMVNDNVQYHGEELPVDFILSDFAEQSGFECVNIWQLARGKGNSSQQMARFGRKEIRKCVYQWRRKDA